MPFYSQIVSEREQEFFPTKESAEFWTDRACGIACVRMIMADAGVDGVHQPQLFWTLIDEGLRTKAYVPAGWVHRGLLRMLEARGIRGRCIRGGTYDDLLRSLEKARAVILSVSVGLRGGKTDENGEAIPRGGHLVVAHRASKDGSEQIWLEHPSSHRPWNWSRPMDAEGVRASMSGNWIELTYEPR